MGNEFELINMIIAGLGDSAGGEHVVAGPGDDGCVIRGHARRHMVSSIDTLVSGVHFPDRGDSALIGYRAVMVSCSDLAAMGADPSHMLVALTMERVNRTWVERLTKGIAAAAQELQIPVTGGNVSRGPVSMTLSVHGLVPKGHQILRNGARPGDRIYVSGSLGAAAAALEMADLLNCNFGDQLDSLQHRYYMPRARLELGVALRGVASAAIDVSDGLLQDLRHLCQASGVGASIQSERVPSHDDAGLQEALLGGDDYELIFTSRVPLPDLPEVVTEIGIVTDSSDILMDNQPVKVDGYQHF